ncbi:MAG TPA: membrane dipeptidase [Caulobacteraceae bacterium]|nr:membrane dipeptidase [Caulobacteraceae bacterium]
MVWPWEPWCGNDLDKLPRFKAAGHDVVSITVAGDNHNISEAVQRVAQVRRLIRDMAPDVRLCGTLDEIAAAKGDGVLAALLHFEGTRCFERNLDMIAAFYDLGVKHTLLAFNNANSVGGGCMEASDGGLTAFGRKLVAEMRRVGMLLDLSHTGHRTAREAMDVWEGPCVFSHSNAAAVFAHPRNLADDEIRACAATGGLVGVSGSSMYHGDPEARAESLFAHLDHMVQLVGPEHVGIGIDAVFDGEAISDWMRGRPEEWPDARRLNWPGVRFVIPEELPRLTDCMLGAGYPEPAIRQILGQNYMRICREVWR